MSPAAQARFWLIGLALFLLSLWLLQPILLPFLAGMGIAYFLDPVCDRLQRWGLSRLAATCIVTVLFSIVIILLLALVVPAAISQLIELIGKLPAVATVLRDTIQDFVGALSHKLQPEIFQRVREGFIGYLTQLAQSIPAILSGLLSGSFAFVNLLSLIFLTPVVAFFMLRDWDLLITRLDSWLPRRHAPTIRRLAKEADDILSAYVRGVATVCLVLATFYATGLTLIGLQSGLIVGILAGLLSFVPFLGSIGGFILSVGLALLQFDDPWWIAATAAVFLVGQTLEGNFLTPKLVGDKIRLHPVVVIFALLAGGTLFGFAGILLALPFAAVAGVLVRFALGSYLTSPLYRQNTPVLLPEGQEPAPPKR